MLDSSHIKTRHLSVASPNYVSIALGDDSVLSLREREFVDAAFHLMKRPQWSLLSSGA